jgi:hypothetical protein
MIMLSNILHGELHAQQSTLGFVILGHRDKKKLFLLAIQQSIHPTVAGKRPLHST